MARLAAFMACLSAASAFIVERDIMASLGPHLSPGAAIYSPSSPDWANESSRWSTYDQPTWVNVVVPAVESDIVATVSTQSLFAIYLITFRSTMRRHKVLTSWLKVAATDIALL
jgi:hypothetical protein